MNRDKSLKSCLLAIVCCLLAFVSNQPQIKTAVAQETVTVGISAQSKPYNYYDDNKQLTGFEIELLEEIDSRLEDYQFDYRTTEFASLFAGLDAGTFDVITNNIGEKTERREKYLFSNYPYVVTHNVLITRPDEGATVTLSDLAGKSMGLVAGSSQAIYMEAYNADHPDDQVVLQYIDADASTIIREVETGRYDATIYSTTYLKDVADTFGIDLVGHEIENEDAIQPPGAYALYRNDADSLKLRQAMDEVFVEMREDGFLSELSIKYFGQDDTGLSEAIIAKNDAIEKERRAASAADSQKTDYSEVVVGTSGQTKPLNFFDEKNQLVGLEVDIIQEIDRRLEEVSFKFELTEFASLFAGLDAGSFDLVANNLGESGDRRDRFLFSLYPYVITHNVIITTEEAADDLSIEDFAGKRFGVVPASPQSLFLEAWNQENPDLAVKIEYVDSDPSTIIRDVYNERFDATIYATTYLYDVEQTFGISLKAHTIDNEDAIRPPGSYFIYRNEDAELRDMMDEVLEEMRADGSLAEISQKYLGQDDTQLTPAIIDKNHTIEAERTGESAEVSEQSNVSIGISAQSKPYNYFDENNQLTGFEIELLEELDQRLEQFTFDYSTTEFASLFAGLDAETFDLITNNIGEKPDRREKYLFSQYPYVITHNVLITRPDAGDTVTLADLAGKSIGLVAGSSQAIFLEQYNEENPDAQVKLEYIDADASMIIREVASGRYDATIYSTTYLTDVENTFGLDLVGHPIENEDAIQPPGAYVLYRDDAKSLALRQAIDEELAKMRADGFLAEISSKYFGQDDTQLTDEIVEKNDAIEADRVAQAPIETATTNTARSSDGKIFAPEVIPQIIPSILEKLPITLLMTVVSALIGLSLGFAIALVKIRKTPILSQVFSVFVSFMRGTPQLVQLFLAFYGFPLVVRWLNAKMGWGIDVNGIPALLYVFVALGLNEAAYNSETFRAAILSVNKIEIEAAKSIGLTNGQTMRRIILPSALIVAIPNLGNSLIGLLKGTSLAFTVTVIDIMGQARIIAGSNLRFFEAYIAVAVIYWLICIIVEQLVRRLERRLNVDQQTAVELDDSEDSVLDQA